MNRYLFALLALPLPLLAQEVGHPPERSPYTDLEYKQQVSLYGGWFAAAKDPAGVAPQAAPMIGARYDVRVAGPASITVRLANAFSEHTVIDPTKPKATRDRGTESASLLLADVGFTLNLTGQKSWHRLVPTATSGLGIASSSAPADTGGYRFGTAFAFSFGTGVRWVPGGRFQLRADVQDYMYNIKYPATFYETTSDETQVVPNTQARTFWKHNAALTLGGSYLFFR